jgi:hypothetical protein
MFDRRRFEPTDTLERQLSEEAERLREGCVSTAFIRTPASSRPLHGGRFVAGRYGPTAADRRSSRPPSARRGGRHRPSGSRRCGSNGSTTPVEYAVESRIAAAPGQVDRSALAWRRQAGRSGRIPSIREASRPPVREFASCGAPCQRRQPASPSASVSACASSRVDRSYLMRT